MKVKAETLERMSLAMRAVMGEQFTKQELTSLATGMLFTWWHMAFQYATYASHPNFSVTPRLYEDKTLVLYPDGTNDATLHTALKKVRDMILETYDDFVMICFPNLMKELSGVSYYKFNHSKAFIHSNGVEVEVPRKHLTSRDPYVLAQIAHTWQTMASPVVEKVVTV